MKKLIKLELIKTLGYPTFRTLIILHFILFLLVVIVGSQISFNVQGVGINMGKLFAFPHVWATFAWIASWFNLLLGIIAIILVGNEHQFNTFRKQIIDGVSRIDLLSAKLFMVILLSLYTLALVLVTGFIFGLLFSSNVTMNSVFSNIYLIFILFIQSFAYMSMGMLFAFLFKNNALSIVAFILFFFPVEPIARAFFPSSIDRFFPIKIISNLTPMPDFVGITTGDLIQVNGKSPLSLSSMGLLQDTISIGLATVICLFYISLFYLSSRYIIEKRNF